jgi:hypothetical protein
MSLAPNLAACAALWLLAPALAAATPAPVPAAPAATPSTPASPPAPAPPPKPAPRPDPTLEAQRHFDLGLALYQEGDLRGALVEFKQAYEDHPTYKVLFNLGVVARELHDWAGALRFHREYLDRGGEWVPRERRLQVERGMVELAERIARVELVIAGGPAEVTIDEQPVSEAEARRPIAVNPGRHRVRVTYPQRTPILRTCEVASGETARLEFQPPPARRTTALPGTPARPAGAATAPAPAGDRLGLAQAGTGGPPKAGGRRSARWTWAATGVAAAGAVAAGLLARQSSEELASERTRYPANAGAVRDLQTRTRIYAMAADGLMVGGAVLAVIATYLSFSGPSSRPAATAQAAGWRWSF